VRWKRGWTALFDKQAAVPKRALTEAQRAAQERQAVKRRTCPGCGTVFNVVLPDDYELRDCPTCARRQVEQDRAAASAAAAKALADRNAVVLDLETTSLCGYAVEIAVIDMQGAVLEREVERLALRRAKAGLLHHLPSEAHRFARRTARTWARRIRWRCAMKRYAAFVGEWSERYEDYAYQPLPGGDHRALGDARAALAVLRRMATAGEEQPEMEGGPSGEGARADGRLA
jgi:hypothetical protein